MTETADPKKRIEELNEKLGEELNNWEKLEVDPNQVIAFNPMRVDLWVKSLTKFLEDKGIIEEDEFVIYFKEQMLDNLIEMREQIEPQVRAARLKASGIELPDSMVVPKSKIRKLH